MCGGKQNTVARGVAAPTPMYPMREIVPATQAIEAAEGVPAGGPQAAVLVYQPFKEHELRSMRDRVMECRNEPQTVRDLIAQWMVTHRCTHRDVGIVCQAILSPTAWREARREAEWPAEEGAEWDGEARQAARDRLYNAIQRALKPPTLDWNSVCYSAKAGRKSWGV